MKTLQYILIGAMVALIIFTGINMIIVNPLIG